MTVLCFNQLTLFSVCQEPAAPGRASPTFANLAVFNSILVYLRRSKDFTPLEHAKSL